MLWLIAHSKSKRQIWRLVHIRVNLVCWNIFSRLTAGEAFGSVQLRAAPPAVMRPCDDLQQTSQVLANLELVYGHRTQQQFSWVTSVNVPLLVAASTSLLRQWHVAKEATDRQAELVRFSSVQLLCAAATTSSISQHLATSCRSELGPMDLGYLQQRATGIGQWVMQLLNWTELNCSSDGSPAARRPLMILGENRVNL